LHSNPRTNPRGIFADNGKGKREPNHAFAIMDTNVILTTPATGGSKASDVFASASKKSAHAKISGALKTTGTCSMPIDDGAAVPPSRASQRAKELRAKAARGDARAQFRLGNMYVCGRGVAKNETEAAKWFRMAAEQGNVDAQLCLGCMHDIGQGVEKNEAEVAKWYRMAARQGHADAQNCLGWMYANGRGVVKNEATAVKWFRMAAEQGNAKGQLNLGWMYASGRGIAKDVAEAAKWYRMAERRHGSATLRWDAGAQTHTSPLFTRQNKRGR